MMLSQVEAMRDQMRPSERKLADYVIEAPREVLDLSMTEVAARAGVSQPTIARFCHALGFSGFREFKIRLAQGIATEVPAVYRDVRPDEPTPGVAAKVLDRTIGAPDLDRYDLVWTVANPYHAALGRKDRRSAFSSARSTR